MSTRKPSVCKPYMHVNIESMDNIYAAIISKRRLITHLSRKSVTCL